VRPEAGVVYKGCPPTPLQTSRPSPQLHFPLSNLNSTQPQLPSSWVPRLRQPSLKHAFLPLPLLPSFTNIFRYLLSITMYDIISTSHTTTQTTQHRRHRARASHLPHLMPSSVQHRVNIPHCHMLQQASPQHASTTSTTCHLHDTSTCFDSHHTKSSL
jgi:hypothetical protein